MDSLLKQIEAIESEAKAGIAELCRTKKANPFAAFRTQAEVDAAIDRYIARAVAAEARRDSEEFESVEYWRHHDRAVFWHEKARSLMPKGS